MTCVREKGLAHCLDVWGAKSVPEIREVAMGKEEMVVLCVDNVEVYINGELSAGVSLVHAHLHDDWRHTGALHAHGEAGGL